MAIPTYLMSYPAAQWSIRGAANFRSQARSTTSPRRAFREWLTLADAILRAGGPILVMPPAATETPLTGMIYTANLGHLFRDQFLLSNMSVAHRRAERDIVRSFMEKAGVSTRDASAEWEGQAELQWLGGNRFVATYGVRSARESVAELRPLLPPNTKLLELQIRDPFFHGDTCLNPITNRAGDLVLLAHGSAFIGATLETLRDFLGSTGEVVALDEGDTLAYACNALCVGGTLLMPSGVSASLRGQLVRRGFVLEELELPELFGKGGGGPRCLVNELRGLVLNPGAPSYAELRDELYKLVESYPEGALNA